MRVFVTGATGLVGRALCRALVDRGDSVVGLSRQARPPGQGISFVAGTARDVERWASAVIDCDAVVNLAGENLAARWSAARKARILSSRIELTGALADIMRRGGPRLLVSASGSSYYGTDPERTFDEASPPGRGFLAEVTQKWEAAAFRAEASGARVVTLRTAVVLSAAGGALAKMLPAFRAGLGGPIGDGQQWLSFVSRHDLVRLILFVLGDEQARGPVNVAAPQPVRQADFARALGRALRRPARLPTPTFALKLVYGAEMVRETLQEGQRVVPRRAQGLGFVFEDGEVDAALRRALADRR